MLGFVSSFLFSNNCYLCSKNIGNKKYLCDKCFEKLEKYKCESNYKSIKKYDKNKLEFLFLFEYKKYIRKLILNYKFKDKSYIGKVFAEYINRNKFCCLKLKSYDIIIPVPMSIKNKLLRGYNQTEIISEDISKSLKIKFIKDGIKKIKKTKRQSSLTREERLLNVKNAYKINENYLSYFENKSIIIFDDIYTTGATIDECIKLFLKLNVKKILILILAKD